LGRVALLVTLIVIVLSYASPARQWIKHEARRLGMVRVGERSYVIENLR
jgi:hypothetical protein